MNKTDESQRIDFSCKDKTLSSLSLFDNERRCKSRSCACDIMYSVSVNEFEDYNNALGVVFDENEIPPMFKE